MLRLAMLGKQLLVALVALLLALLALVGTAFFTDSASWLTGMALVVLAIVNFGGQAWLVDRRLVKKPSIVPVVSTLLLLGFFAVAVLLPAAGEPFPTAPDVQDWDLPTGSRIAYHKLAPATPAHPEPIIFVHGGPGVADLAGDAAYFGRLREEGYVVYVYDQVGAGRSSRLQDPSGYTIERSVADLEAIRQQIGAEQIILIGHSYGAGVAALYSARHGEHVAKLIVASPGALVGGLAEGGVPQDRLTPTQKLHLYALILQPRPFTVYTLLLINPRAAHAFAGDAEMDARMDAVYAVTEPALHCEPPATARPLQGVGFYANQFPQSGRYTPPSDVAQALQRYAIPTLVIKGACDYLNWASALAYLDAFQQGPAHLVYLHDAGHNVYQDQPQAFAENMKAFLQGQPLPNEYSSRSVPADYEKGY
ncbi:MAG: alpha/beta hydrolase [Caldilinea sp. CFX5]|nr:alpha/beta hydrolase [Caldilinea sp. CFX5]